MSELLRTCLYEAHRSLNGRLVPFAGYEMPVQYTSIIAEAEAVRNHAGMFDVSHMGRISVFGDDVKTSLDYLTTNDLGKLSAGKGQYSMLTNAKGGVVDDIIITERSSTQIDVVINASNHAKDVSHIQAHLKPNLELVDKTDETFMIAVQGPAAVAIIEEIFGQPSLGDTIPAFGFVELQFSGSSVQATRSGYTGEDGFELIGPSEVGEALWNRFVEAGVTPCGLASRDTLRVEAGLPLYGHELEEDINPIEAGLGWAVSKTKAFLGSEFIQKMRAEGAPRKLVGIQLEARRLLTPGTEIHRDGGQIGTLTSGVVSPLLGCGIGMAFVNAADAAEGDCHVLLRGNLEPARIVSKRFYKRK